MAKFAYGLYCLALILAPLLFGAQGTGGKAWFEFCVFSSLVLYGIHLLKTRGELYRPPALVPLLLLNGWMALQLAPLPAGLVGLISPATLAVYQEALGDAVDDSFLTLSLHPQETLAETLRFLSYTTLYLLSVQFLCRRSRLKQTMVLVVGFAGLLALEGCWQKLFVPGKALGIRQTADPFGPFPYRNHFAGFMDLLLPLTFALAAFHQPYVRYAKTFQAKCIALLSDLKPDAFLVFFASSIIMVTAVLLNPSMGGQIWTAVAVMVLLLLAPDIPLRTRATVIMIIFLVAALSAGQVGRQSINTRFGETLENEFLEEDAQVTFHGRTEFWQDAVHIVADFPITGTGSGAFFRIFPSYRTFSARLNVAYAHNDYIQVAVELGGLGLLLLALFFLFFLRQNIPAFLRLQDRYAKYVTVGCGVGVLALLLHCITEFQFYGNGAVGLYFFFFLGVISAAVHISRSGKIITYLPVVKSRIPVLAIVSTGLVLVALVPWLYRNTLSAQRILQSEKLLVTPAASREDFESLLVLADRLTALEPLNAWAWYLRAYAAEMLGNESAAEQGYRRSLLLDPTSTAVLQNYSRFLEKNGRIEEADRCLQAAIHRNQAYPPLYQAYGRWLLSHGRLEEAKEFFRKIFVLVPEASADEMDKLVSAGIPLAEIENLLPDRVEPWAAYAEAVLAKEGDVERAALLHEKALGFLGNENRPKRSFFYVPYRFFSKFGQYEKATNIIRRGVCLLPDDYGLHIALGDIYRRQGYDQMARDEYRQALRLKPDSVSAIDRLVDDTIKYRLEKFGRLGR